MIKRKMCGRLGLAVALLLALSMVGCSDDGSPPSDTPTPVNPDTGDATGDATDTDGPPDVGTEVGPITPDADTAPDADVPIVEGSYGTPCRANRDCLDGYCVASGDGFVCSQLCVGSCPPVGDTEFACRRMTNAGGDNVSVCLPIGESICTPCIQDRNCPDGLCVNTESGRACGIDCETNDDCPGTSACFRALGGVTFSTPQCLPFTGACDCSEENRGETRPCARSNADETRTCVGVETCDPDIGWVGCTAPVPVPEVCDGTDNDCNGLVDDGLELGGACLVTAAGVDGACPGVEVCGETGIECLGQIPTPEICDRRDNDCDGMIDEDFRNDDGLYVSDVACGGCGNVCADRFPADYGSACELVDGAPTCVVTACPPGTAPAGRIACVPLDSAICFACASDSDCNALVGDRCLEYPDGGTYCGRDCSPTSPFGEGCPDGYLCDATEQQCMVENGTCACGPGDDFFLACTVRAPGGEVCLGTQQCDDGNVGACVPPVEVCDGIDNNCNGVIDEGFMDGDRRYTSDTHCGRCFNDCTIAFGDDANADGVCDASSATPACALDCDPGFFDADGLSFNGCECSFISDTDEPDPLGIDANCDGIDGEIDRGVFVATYGSDTAGDGTIDNPYRTIQRGIDQAVTPDRNHVYVSAGVYEESIDLRPGVSIFGGYGFDYRTRDLQGNETAIVGVAPTGALRGTVNARNISVETRVEGFTIVGFDASGAGENSYAVYARNATNAVSFSNNVVRAGRGGPGDVGTGGTVGRTATGAGFTAAQPGGPGIDTGGRCASASPRTVPGGNGAQFTCTSPGGTNVPTHGGSGATTVCPIYDTEGARGALGTATPGPPGTPNTTGGERGIGGYSSAWVQIGGSCSFCIIPFAPTGTIEGLAGGDGRRGAPGVAGSGCSTPLGSVVAGEWRAGTGAAGGRGGPGSGGGGGGAGGGTHDRTPIGDSFYCSRPEFVGGSGGGGGAGGCGGEAGTGGASGGGSFGFFISYSSAPTNLPVLRDNRVFRGRGGDGGDGGPGGEGGEGSTGATGTVSTTLGCVGVGGTGGLGGSGGAGGGGGGGCGGPAVGIYVGVDGGALPGGVSTAPYLANNLFPASGAGGARGDGGASAGNDGINGAAGTTTTVVP